MHGVRIEKLMWERLMPPRQEEDVELSIFFLFSISIIIHKWEINRTFAFVVEKTLLCIKQK
jgi:hypothetical protein